MRLAGDVPGYDPADPRAFARRVRAMNYGAVEWPSGAKTDDQTDALLAALAAEDVVVAEVGAWSNPISPDPHERARAVEKCVRQLALADRVAARCCVNIAGSRSPDHWDGPHPQNLTRETFDLIVQSVRQIIDAVRPTQTFYTLEMMPWIYPDSPASYLELIRAIDRPAFGVHVDPVNVMNCPARVFDTTAVLHEIFETLGPWVKTCHAKDVRCQPKLTFHVDEVRPGTGVLDYPTYLRLLDQLHPDTTLRIEHLRTPEEYAAAAEFIRGVADREGLRFR